MLLLSDTVTPCQCCEWFFAQEVRKTSEEQLTFTVSLTVVVDTEEHDDSEDEKVFVNLSF